MEKLIPCFREGLLGEAVLAEEDAKTGIGPSEVSLCAGRDCAVPRETSSR